jgi:H+-translocating NAD(P) transhydrogenase subunit beta
VSGSPDILTVAGGLTALLFLLSLWGPVAQGRHAAIGGILILVAVTLYNVDVVNLPEVVGAAVIGTVLGFALARELPMRVFPRLLGVLTGSIGTAVIAMLLAVERNSNAFGLAGEGSDMLAPNKAIALSLGAIMGAMAATGGAVALLDRPGRANGWLLCCLPLGLAAVPSALFVQSAETIWLWAGIVPAGFAGMLFGRRLLDHGPTALLAMTCGMVGWSVAATAFLLENMGLAIAGGLAGSAGSVVTLRLCHGPSGKGLADARRHP